ncbi:MAG: RNB domain-containing ribonuclease, partial [Clostridia bacterium]|nr:RNB domain-containing ribonuclease [Clostridia bacterium]
KLKSFAVFAHNAGLSTHALMTASEEIADLSARALSRSLTGILDEAERAGKGDIVSSVLLRSMMKAKYNSHSSMHFGLGARCYCHFTSPIRRYPDLFVHTVITDVLEKCGLSELSASSDVDPALVSSLDSVAYDRAVSSTEAEIRAVEAERAIEDMYMTVYMSKHVGEEFDVTVISVIRSGMFVRCDNLIEGFVPAVFFPSCRINDELMTLECGGKVYTLGTRMRVKLTEADVSASKITFDPIFMDSEA